MLDTNSDGRIDFDELVDGLAHYVVEGPTTRRTTIKRSSTHSASHGGEEVDEEEEDDMPDEWADLKPAEQQARVKKRAFYLMFVGTLIVLLFSDPMVSVLSSLGSRTGIPAFYISFVLAPLASNASELLASYNYATKKTKTTITISFSALQGAATMNNTFCLAIFFILIYVQNLVWEFSAETLAILAVEIIMFFYSLKKVHNIFDGLVVFSLFPLSILFIALLENVAHLN